MTPEEQSAQMKRAIVQAIKVMGDRFGSTEQDVARTIQELKVSIAGYVGDKSFSENRTGVG